MMMLNQAALVMVASGILACGIHTVDVACTSKR